MAAEAVEASYLSALIVFGPVGLPHAAEEGTRKPRIDGRRCGVAWAGIDSTTQGPQRGNVRGRYLNAVFGEWMHPIRELPRPRPRGRLHATRPSLRLGNRDPAPLPERSARELAAVAALALAAGAALEFFLDPRNGKRRRHLVRDRTRATFRRQARKVERQAHYEAGKIVGVTHAVTHHAHDTPELDDVSLVRKVETELFRDRTIPKGPISINADRGIVVLRGQLEDPEQIPRIERDVRRVAGVRDVENLLHPPGVPAPAARRCIPQEQPSRRHLSGRSQRREVVA